MRKSSTCSFKASLETLRFSVVQTLTCVKSEIHDCTIILGDYLSQNGLLDKKLIDDIEKAKQTRVDMQYYVAQELSEREIKRAVGASRKFVLDIEKEMMNLTIEQIENIRQKLRTKIQS